MIVLSEGAIIAHQDSGWPQQGILRHQTAPHRFITSPPNLASPIVPTDSAAAVEVDMIERTWEMKIEPLTVRISTAVRITGLSRSRIYELIQSGELDTVKVGRATLVQYASLKQLTANRTIPAVG